MEEQSAPRRGRPRKVVAVPNAVDEGADAHIQHDGNREAGGTRTESQADPGRAGKGLPWVDFVAKIAEIHRTKGRSYMAKAFHPAPEADNLGDNIVTPIEVGEAGFIRPHGEIIKF